MQEFTDVSDFIDGSHEICFHYELNGADPANYFFDYVEITGVTPSTDLSFSTVKSLY